MILPHNLSMLPGVLLAVAAQFSGSWANPNNFLSDKLVVENRVQNVLEHRTAKYTECRQKTTGPIETTLCDYETVESVNQELYSHLHELVKTPFFRYFQVDLYRDCQYWDDAERCANRECAISPVDESEIPEKWRAASLSRVEELRSSLPGCYYRDSDFCFLESLTDGEYVDLSDNPERFTGYDGPSAHRIWNAIYQENCFGLAEKSQPSSSMSSSSFLLSSNPLSSLSPPEEEDASECLEKRVYYKIISGLHASISTHICHEYLDQATGEWGPNLECFISRVASHPERLQYIYFNTVLLLRAVARIGPYLSAYDICTGNERDEIDSRVQLSKVIEIAEKAGRFDETSLFRGEDAKVLKEEFKAHFRNVSSIMDCVGCARCRLWGKVQFSGVGAALKILFELDETALDPQANPNLLTRSEIVAIINTLHRFTESLYAVEGFRALWSATDDPQALLTKVESQKTPSSPATSPSPRAGSDKVDNTLYGKLLSLAQLCRRSTKACAEMVMTIFDSLGALFRLSDKDGMPHPDL
jgi:hypothetical protein